MTRTTKAVLLSALLFPGTGQFLLKRYAAGALLMVTSLLSLTLLISDAVSKAQEITDRIISGHIGADLASVSAALAQQSEQADTSLLQFSTYLLVGSWLFGIVHAIWVGRRAKLVPSDSASQD
ncbi:hypothetical protein [Bowmanella dokdonensis]|uniref:DUF5683 domain-containing protein n=1 Tax=Bowmanella dokdonensis TaxID=751969 RepID=A0A939ISU1_9ALTE|nr:hypothetical protein [Bowmanella dokdonensis]MBN7826786.1 hypothetical protein [Bowmanella dokdonensis]